MHNLALATGHWSPASGHSLATRYWQLAKWIRATFRKSQ